MNGDDRLIGEIHAMTKKNGQEIGQMVDLIRDVRENGTVICKENTDKINKLTRGMIILFGIIFGADKILDLFL